MLQVQHLFVTNLLTINDKYINYIFISIYKCFYKKPKRKKVPLCLIVSILVLWSHSPTQCKQQEKQSWQDLSSLLWHALIWGRCCGHWGVSPSSLSCACSLAWACRTCRSSADVPCYDGSERRAEAGRSRVLSGAWAEPAHAQMGMEGDRDKEHHALCFHMIHDNEPTKNYCPASHALLSPSFILPSFYPFHLAYPLITLVLRRQQQKTHFILKSGNVYLAMICWTQSSI